MEATRRDRGEEEKPGDYVFHFFLLGLIFFFFFWVSLLSYLLDLMPILGIECLSTCNIERDIPT